MYLDWQFDSGVKNKVNKVMPWTCCGYSQPSTCDAKFRTSACDWTSAAILKASSTVKLGPPTAPASGTEHGVMWLPGRVMLE